MNKNKEWGLHPLWTLPKSRKVSHPFSDLHSTRNESTFEEGTAKNEKEKERSVVSSVPPRSVAFGFVFIACSPPVTCNAQSLAFRSVCTANSFRGEVRCFEIHQMDPGWGVRTLLQRLMMPCYCLACRGAFKNSSVHCGYVCQYSHPCREARLFEGCPHKSGWAPMSPPELFRITCCGCQLWFQQNKPLLEGEPVSCSSLPLIISQAYYPTVPPFGSLLH